jgi:hypothetical protein
VTAGVRIASFSLSAGRSGYNSGADRRR